MSSKKVERLLAEIAEYRRRTGEGTERVTQCHLCKKILPCTYLKTSHVPIRAFVCEGCREEWCAE